jgi:acyl-CoA synthetase (AMP-forming)/AMP-acid ligase II
LGGGFRDVNIVDAFEFQALHHPASLAVIVPGASYGPVSYGRLRAMANNVGRRCLSLGIRPGATVAILSNDPVFHLATLIGLARIGVVTLSTGNPVLPDEFTVDAAITDTDARIVNCAAVLRPDFTWTAGDGAALPRATAGSDAQDLARIAMTSATTGDPKAIGLSHDMLVKRFQAYDVAFGDVVPTSSRVFLDVGLTTSFGYTWAMGLLARGAAIFFRGTDPAETLQAFGLYKVQCMIGSPASAAEFLEYYERASAFRCPFEVMLSSGGLLSDTLSARVRARMCSNLIATYAATEISPLASAPAHLLMGIDGAVGFIAPWVGAEIVDDNDDPLKPGEEGRVRFRGHTCVSGYVGNPRLSDTVFKDGWFYPGDLGAIRDDRMLIIAGRERAVINVGGNKINPEIVESVLMSCPGVAHAAAIARPNALGIDEVWALVTGYQPLDVDAVRAFCQRNLAPQFVPVNILQVAGIPRNDMGRVNRRSVAEIAAKLPVK